MKCQHNKPLEIILKGTPKILYPIIKTTVSEFEAEAGLAYGIEEETDSSTDDYKKLLVIVLEIIENSIASADCIGIITLQSLENNQTLLRIPPRGHWFFNNAPDVVGKLEMKGHVSKDEFNLYLNESYFTKVLEKIVSEFYRLSLLDLKTEKEPLGFRLPKKEQI